MAASESRGALFVCANIFKRRHRAEHNEADPDRHR